MCYDHAAPLPMQDAFHGSDVGESHPIDNQSPDDEVYRPITG
jgi:hypothetical protein